MKQFIKNIYHDTILGYYLIYPFYFTYEIMLRIVPDKTFVKFNFKRHMGYSLNLKNPKTLNEKINWLKLHDRTSLQTICSDKFKVRDYIREKIGGQYLVPLCYETKNPRELIPENLPNYPFIIKTNHNSAGGIIVKEKKEVDWWKVQFHMRKLLRENYYYRTREWQYKNIEPRIVVEKLLQNNAGKIPFDYKLHCFNGKVVTIQVDMDRGSENHSRNWYDTNWKREPFKWSSVKGDGKKTDPSQSDVEKPVTLDKMIKLSQILAEPFSYVRVDWYDVDSILYFGELTFHHDGGNRPIEPKEWDLKLGEKLILNKPSNKKL